MESNYMNKEEVLQLVDRCALEAMSTPYFGAYGTEKPTLAELANANSLVAAHNEGIRELVNTIRDTLNRKEEEDA